MTEHHSSLRSHSIGQPRKIALAAGAVLLSLLGCAADLQDQGSAAVDQPQTEVGEASVQERLLAEAPVLGGTARFLAIGTDGVLVESTTTQGVLPPLQDPAVVGLSHAELYTYWSGMPAPTELVEYTRGMLPPVPYREAPGLNTESATTEEPAQTTEANPGLSTARDVGVSAAALTAQEFSQQFCGGKQVCWLDRTGNGWTERRSSIVGYTANAVRGSFTVKLQYKSRPNGSWRLGVSRDVPEGAVVGGAYSAPAVFDRHHRFKVENGEGDHWHAGVVFY